MRVAEKARKERPKNTWEQTIKKDTEKLSLMEQLCGNRREWHLRISRFSPAQCGKRAGG